MKTIKISMQGTLETIKYCVLAMWQGWRLEGVRRIPHPTEYTLEMTPPGKASTRQGRKVSKIVFLLTIGDGSDGSEWDLQSIHSTFELATAAKEKYEAPRMRPDGSTYIYEARIEEWEIDCPPPLTQTVSPHI